MTAEVRRRDPRRKEAILEAAATLVAGQGYAAVSMADIGAAVGIRASAIYHHYASKQVLLVALFDQCLDRLAAEQDDAVARLGGGRATLLEVVRLQVRFVVDERAFARVYYAEARSLPPEDLARLRRKQRRYVETWCDLLVGTRPDLDRVQAAERVHAAIGAVQASLVHTSPLDADDLRELLVRIGTGVLDMPA